MKDEYYTPEIEEFHIGFEYETLDWTGFTGELGENSNYDWVSFTITENSKLSEFIEMIKNEDIRVKYLDKEDIESLGWKLYKDEMSTYKFYNRGYILTFYSRNTAIEIEYEYEEYSTTFTELKFDGCIKNKSELITLMKWLNI